MIHKSQNEQYKSSNIFIVKKTSVNNKQSIISFKSQFSFLSIHQERSYNLSIINITINLFIISDSEFNDNNHINSLISLIDYCFDVISRLDQSSVLYFDNTNIMKFLHYWNNEYEDFGFIESQRYIHLSNYCILEIKDTIEFLFDYKDRN